MLAGVFLENPTRVVESEESAQLRHKMQKIQLGGHTKNTETYQDSIFKTELEGLNF